jgi:hypothetical protein
VEALIKKNVYKGLFFYFLFGGGGIKQNRKLNNTNKLGVILLLNAYPLFVFLIF